MNNKGQTGFGWITGLIVMVMAILLFAGVFPAIITAFGLTKNSDSANCAGYTDPDATLANNKSYDSSKNTDTLSCTILNFGPGIIVVAVIFGIVAGLISGNLGRVQQPQYPQY